jgi:hypothetical protein
MLLLLQLAGLIVPFVLLLPLTTGDPQDYLVNAAGASTQIRVAVFLLFANCALTVGISIAAFGVFRRKGEALALSLLAMSVIMFVLQAVDNAHVLSMLSLSQRYAGEGGPEELFRTLATVVGSTRRWVHLTELLAIDAWIFLLYAMLYRHAAVPRPLAAFGLVTVLLHCTGIPLRGFFGYGPVTLMGASIAVSHVVLAIWLMIRGFHGHRRPHRAEAVGVARDHA